jgi:hypothetical protein
LKLGHPTNLSIHICEIPQALEEAASILLGQGPPAGLGKLTGKPLISFHWGSILAVDGLLISHLRRRFDAQRLSAPTRYRSLSEITVNLTMP